MTLQQVKTFIIGVLKGWFTNKAVLDKIDVNDEGNLVYDDKVVGGAETYTDEQVTEAVTEALSELNAAPTDAE